MGTLVRITLYAPGEQAAKDAFSAAFDRIRNLDRILSDYRPDSELNQITKAAVGRAVRVSEDLFTVLAASQELAEATGGAFDITQGPVVRLWREARATARLPDPAAAGRRCPPQRLPQAPPRRRASDRDVRHGRHGTGRRRHRQGLRRQRGDQGARRTGSAERTGGGERRSRVQRGAPGTARLANRRLLGRGVARRARNAGADQRGRLNFGQQRAARGHRRPPLLAHHRPRVPRGSRRRHHGHRHRDGTASTPTDSTPPSASSAPTAALR